MGAKKVIMVFGAMVMELYRCKVCLRISGCMKGRHTSTQLSDGLVNASREGRGNVKE